MSVGIQALYTEVYDGGDLASRVVAVSCLLPVTTIRFLLEMLLRLTI